MAQIPSKVKTRLIEGVKKFKPIVTRARAADINESDTVTIISDFLSEVFNYDKYSEITSEFAIKKTFCDIAIVLDGTPTLLLEAKAAGLTLNDRFIKQAVDYASNAGIDWVILTNSVQWMVYKIIFAKPVSAELIYQFDLSEINIKKDDELELLYFLSKESIAKGAKSSLNEYRSHKQIMNKYVISQLLTTPNVIAAIKKSIKQLDANTKPSDEEIIRIINDEIIKRDILDDEKTPVVKKSIQKTFSPKKETVKKVKKPVDETSNEIN